MTALATFDGDAMMRALDAQRTERGLGWTDTAHQLWDQSLDLNAELGGNTLCQGALIRTVKRGTMSCQYALIVLRWLGRPPEDFLTGPVVTVASPDLPDAGPDHRLRWDLPRLHRVLNARRVEQGLTWAALADVIGCTPSRLTNLRTARLADMGLAMRVTQWLGEPAAAFVHPARW